MTDAPSKPYLTPTEVAALLMVSPVTVRQWSQKGMLRAETTPGGHRRYLRASVELFAREHGLTFARPAGHEPRVLIVDDDRQFADYVVELLSGRPEPIVSAIAHDGFDAGRLIPTFRPAIVVLDLRMPGLDGYEVCRRLKQDPATRAVRVIAVSGHVTRENAKNILTLGAECVLRKPLQDDELLTALGFSTGASPTHGAPP